MKLAVLAKLLEAELICCQHKLDTSLSFVSAGDLMSDILVSSYPGALLITGLVNVQVVRTAEMLDMAGVVFTSGKKPTRDMTELAIKKDIPLFVTPKTIYLSCGLLYAAGLRTPPQAKTQSGCK